MHRLRAFFLCLTLSALVPAPTAAEGAGGVLLVLEKAANNLVIIDPVTSTILGRVPVGADPHEVVASDDGRVAYISNYVRGTGTTIARVDLVNRTPLPPIDLGALTAPHGLAFAGGKLYFTAEGARAVVRWDPATEKIDWVMGTGRNRTHMVIVSRDLKTVFTSDDGSAMISVISQSAAPSPASGAAAPGPNATAGRGGRGGRGGQASPAWTIDTVGVGLRSEGFALSPDGKELWVANAQLGTISIVDVATRTIVQDVPSNKSVNRLAFSPDGRYVFVPDLAGSSLLVVDAATRTAYGRIALPGTSEGVVIAPDGKRAYVTLTSRGSVAAIDVQAMAVSGEIQTGPGPDGLAWAMVR